MFLKTKIDFSGFSTKKITQIIKDIIQVLLANNNTNKIYQADMVC
jgi:hypothetical protein